jgi:hypothetical protein
MPIPKTKFSAPQGLKIVLDYSAQKNFDWFLYTIKKIHKGSRLAESKKTASYRAI